MNNDGTKKQGSSSSTSKKPRLLRVLMWMSCGEVFKRNLQIQALPTLFYL